MRLKERFWSPSPSPASAMPSQTQPSTGKANLTATGSKPWVQSILAIATGYLFLALGVIAIMGLLVLQGIEAFSPNLLLILTLAQLCLATAGGYITALLAPSKGTTQPAQSLTKHGLGLAALVVILWLISAITSNGQAPWSLQTLNLVTALMGISTGTWLRSRQIQPGSA